MRKSLHLSFKRKLCCIVVFLQFMPACSVMQSWVGPAKQRYEESLQAHYYRQALRISEKALAASQKDSDSIGLVNSTEQWQIRYEQALDLASSYLKKQQELVDSLQTQNDWLQANEKIRFMRKHMPESEDVNHFISQYESERSEYIAALKRSLLLLDSQSIPENIQLYQKLYVADDRNKKLRKKLKRLLAARDQLIVDLNAQIEQAETKEDLKNALVYARALQRVEDSPNVLDKIKRIREELGVRNLAVSNRANIGLTTQQKQQLNDYGKAIVEERWIDARSLLSQMLAERPADGELLGQDTYLKEVFQQKVREAREDGEHLYAEGNIEEALNAWQSVVSMAPNDLQLAANIERAQRILAKVQALKNTDLNQE